VTLAALRFSETTRTGVRARVRTLLRRKWFLLALVGIGWAGAMEAGIVQWLPAYAETSLAFPQWVSASALVVFYGTMTVGRMVIGASGDRFDPSGFMARACACAVMLFLFGALLPMPTAALSACVTAGFSVSCLWPKMLAISGDRYPETGASMYAALAACGSMGGVVTPWLVGAVADRADLHLGLAAAALTPALMLPVVRALRPTGRTPAFGAGPDPGDVLGSPETPNGKRSEPPN